MKVEVEQKMSEDYFKELYGEMVKYRLKYRKWQIPISILLLLISFPVFFIDEKSYIISIGIALFAIRFGMDFFLEKNKWMKHRMKSKMMDRNSSFIFEDDFVHNKGSFTESKGGWNSFTEAIETPKGIFLVVDKGMSVYLQKKNFKDKNEIDFVIQKVKSAN